MKDVTFFLCWVSVHIAIYTIYLLTHRLANTYTRIHNHNYIHKRTYKRADEWASQRNNWRSINTFAASLGLLIVVIGASHQHPVHLVLCGEQQRSLRLTRNTKPYSTKKHVFNTNVCRKENSEPVPQVSVMLDYHNRCSMKDDAQRTK